MMCIWCSTSSDSYNFRLNRSTEKLMVLLRDGRTLIGYLRSVDQFANLVLHKTIERIHVGNEYGDIPRGIFIIRGENVVLLGEIVSDWRSIGSNWLTLFFFFFFNIFVSPFDRIAKKRRLYRCKRYPSTTYWIRNDANTNNVTRNIGSFQRHWRNEVWMWMRNWSMKSIEENKKQTETIQYPNP